MPKYSNQADVIKELNALVGYEGYVQFSHKELQIIDPNEIVASQQTDAFLVEAYYYNKAEDKCIAVRHYAGAWYWDDKIDLSEAKDTHDRNIYQTKYGKNVILSQIWTEEDDAYCNGWKVKKLQKVVFSGFDKTEGGAS